MTVAQITNVVWAAVVLGEVWVALLLLRPANRNRFPLFTSYVVFCCVRSAALITITVTLGLRSHAYYYLYWTGAALGVMLMAGVIYEVFADLFLPLWTLPKHAGTVFIYVLATIVSISALVGLWAPSTNPYAVSRFILTLDRSTTFATAAAFAFVLLFARYFGVPWRRQTFGIAAGFMFTDAVELTVSAVIAVSRPALASMIHVLAQVAFVIAETVWIGYFLRQEAERTEPSDKVLAAIRQVQDDAKSAVGYMLTAVHRMAYVESSEHQGD